MRPKRQSVKVSLSPVEVVALISDALPFGRFWLRRT